MSVVSASRAELLRVALDTEALLFGDFVTKAGRETPYFFNSSRLCTGRGALLAGQALADAAIASGLDFDMLFGPAYKGISLAAVTALALRQAYGRDVGFAYDRKERKDHGEGGALAGAELKGRVLIVDDVLSAGTSTRQAIRLVQDAGAQPAGLLLLLDRQERGKGSRSAAGELAGEFGIEVCRVFGLDSLIAAMRAAGMDRGLLKRVDDYRKKYGAS